MRIRFENQERCMQNVENKKAYPINPPIPEGYFRDVTIEEFFVIQRMSDGSRFVWISVKSVESDGTFIKRKVGSKKFISMAFLKNVNLNEAFKKEFALQCESVKNMEGFIFLVSMFQKIQMENLLLLKKVNLGMKLAMILQKKLQKCLKILTK